jgi:hypothetical protein
MARQLARKGKRGLVAIGESQLMERVGVDDLGLRAHEVIAARRAMHVLAIEHWAVADRERVGGPESAGPK